MAERTILTGITADAFTSDADRWALDKLKKVPLLPMVIQKFYELGIDRWMYCWNMSQSVRCGPNQYKTIYEMMRESCAVLDMPEPELYVSSYYQPNAHTSGVERPYITINSAALNNLNDEELYFLIGHELGHIKAKHVLYMSVANVLYPLLQMIGRSMLGLGDVASIALYLAYYEWLRQAEFSADRAGLLVSQSLDSSIDGLISLTAGPNRFRHEQNRDEFMAQARAYQDANTADQIGKILIFLLISHQFSHPMPVHRAQELERWHLSGAYDRIMAGDYPKVEISAA